MHGTKIYVIVLRRDPSQNRAPRRGRPIQRCHRCPTGYAPPESSASGASDSLSLDCRALRRNLEAAVKPAFPPSVVVPIKALACELPHPLGLPLSPLSIAEIRQHLLSQGLVAESRGATWWRWLRRDALRPGPHRSGIFPRDPKFADQAGPHPRSLPTRWGGRPTGPRRLRPFRRPKDQHSGSSPETADFASCSAPPHPG